MTFNKLSFEEKAIISMKRKNLTLGDIAKKLDISTPYVSDIIKGNRKAEKYRNKIIKLLEIEE